MSNLIAEFVELTKKPLFETREEIMEFVSQESNIRKYISGELGSNELLNSKAEAFLKYSDDLHSALKKSVLFYLEKNDLLTLEIEEYIKQAVNFSRLRKFDIHNIHATKEGQFTFDFLEAAKSGYQINPSALKTGKVRFKFYHDMDSLNYIENRMECWGKDTLPEIGKLLQKTNLELMAHKVCLV